MNYPQPVEEQLSLGKFDTATPAERPYLFASEKLTVLIDEIVALKIQWNLTPEQNRYVDRQVRSNLGLVIEHRPKKLPVYLTPTEIGKFLRTAQEISPKHRLLCEILIFTGVRINELRHIDMRDFQDNNQLFIKYGKGGKERYVPITDSLYHKVQLYADGRKQGVLFMNRRHQRYTVRMLQYMVSHVIKTSGIEKNLSTHSLRHTFACLSLAKGMSLEEVQVLMGHSSIKTTEIYARMELSAIKEKYLELVGGGD